MNLDVGELRNRLRSRSDVYDDEPKSESDLGPRNAPTDPESRPTGDLGPENGPKVRGCTIDLGSGNGRPEPSTPVTLPADNESSSLEGAASVPAELITKAQNSSCQHQDEYQDGTRQSQEEYVQRIPQALPAKLKLMPFMGELNSRLQSRLVTEGQKVDTHQNPPKVPPKPKISPKPATTTTTTLEPKSDCSSPTSFLSQADLPFALTNISNLETPPAGPCILGEKADGPVKPPQNKDTEFPHVPNGSVNGSLPTEDLAQGEAVLSKSTKASFLQELKRKILPRPRKKSEADPKKVDWCPETEDLVPRLTHNCAKHRLLVRPRKTHRLTYVEFRKSRCLQDGLQQSQESSTELETQMDHILTETKMSSDPVKQGAKEEQEDADVTAWQPQTPAFAEEAALKGGSPEIQDYSVSAEELQSPGSSSDGNISAFHTPPESPSCSSEMGHSESMTDVEFCSASSELALDAFDTISVASNFDNPDPFQSKLESEELLILGPERSPSAEDPFEVPAPQNCSASPEPGLEVEKDVKTQEQASDIREQDIGVSACSPVSYQQEAVACQNEIASSPEPWSPEPGLEVEKDVKTQEQASHIREQDIGASACSPVSYQQEACQNEIASSPGPSLTSQTAHGFDYSLDLSTLTDQSFFLNVHDNVMPEPGSTTPPKTMLAKSNLISQEEPSHSTFNGAGHQGKTSRAAQLKLQHEIGIFEKKVFVASKTLDIVSDVTEGSDLNRKNSLEGSLINATGGEDSSAGRVPQNSEELQYINSLPTPPEGFPDASLRVSIEGHYKATEVDGGLMSEEMDDFVLVEVPKGTAGTSS